MGFELVQIYYDDKQKDSCFSFARLYFNQKLSIYFENDPIKDVVLSTKADKIAVCSWRLKEKLRWSIGRPREITQELLNSDYDVLSFTKNTKTHGMLYAADRWHPGFMTCFRKILQAIDKKCPGEVKNPIYQNHFSAKTEIYRDYVTRYLSPAMDAIKNDPEINKLAMIDSNYSKLDRTTLQNSDKLMKDIGVPYYPLVPFLLERLFSVYIENEKINVSWL
jgi:hypothetical protein